MLSEMPAIVTTSQNTAHAGPPPDVTGPWHLNGAMKHDDALQLRLSAETKAMLDDLRRAEADLPSRSEMIRRLNDANGVLSHGLLDVARDLPFPAKRFTGFARVSCRSALIVSRRDAVMAMTARDGRPVFRNTDFARASMLVVGER